MHSQFAALPLFPDSDAVVGHPTRLRFAAAATHLAVAAFVAVAAAREAQNSAISVNSAAQRASVQFLLADLSISFVVAVVLAQLLAID